MTPSNPNGKGKNPEVGALSEGSATSKTVADNGDRISKSEQHLVTSTPKRHCKARKSENSFDQEVFCSMMAKVILCHGLSVSMVEHEGFRDMVSNLNPNVKHITRHTILKYCAKENEMLKAQVCQLLSEVPGKISFTCDMWYSCSSRGYLALTAHFVDKCWKLQSKVLSFRFTEPPHNGSTIYPFVLDIINEWHLKGKAFSMTVGDADDMDVMIEHVRKDLHSTCALPCGGKFFHIRCAGQILNTIVQSGMKLIEEIVWKLRGSVGDIHYYDSAHARFEQAIKDSQSDFSGKLELDDPTRWDSTYSMLCKCLEAKAPIVKFASQEICSEYVLLEEEWKTIQDMCDFLRPFYKITLLFSGSEYPTANLYFPYIVEIKYLLDKASNHFIDSIGQITAPMLQKFEKYWDNYTLILSIAVLLDPRYKFRYVEFLFDKVYVGQEYEDKVKAVYDAFIELYTFHESSSTPVQTNASSTPNSSYLNAYLVKVFDMDKYESKGTKSDIDLYLYSPCVPRTSGGNFDVLQYWKDQREYSPVLSLMARDVLAIPISSFASETSFSMSGRILTKLRSSAMPKNMEAFVTVQNWMFGYGDFE